MSSLSRLPGLVSEYFIIEALSGSSRTADVYKALDKFKRQRVALWKSRVPLSTKQGQLDKFASRIAQMIRLNVGTEITAFGVDAAGYGFAVFPPADGVSIASGNIEFGEMERRFLSVLRIADKLHSSGVALEDFTIDSFVVNRSGTVILLDIAASFDTEVEGTKDLPPIDSLRYLPPEHRNEGGGSIAGDVFGLGVLAYRLFVGEYPELNSDETYEGLVPPSERVSRAPGWLDQVVHGCLATQPENRFASASAVLTAITSWREMAIQLDIAPALVDDSKTSKRTHTVGSAAVPIALGHRMGERKAEPVPEPPKKEPRKIGIIGGAAMLGILCAGTWLVIDALFTKSKPRPQGVVTVLPGDLPLGAEGGADEIGAAGKYITQLVTSDDPLAHDTLIRKLSESKTKPFADFVWRSILDRARRVGAQRASDQLRAWGKSQGVGFNPTGVEGLLKAIDVAYPTTDRVAALTEAYEKYPKLVIRITAALVLDLRDVEQFRALLARMARDVMKIDDADQHSSLALMLLLPEVNSIFIDDISLSMSKVPDEDLKWVLIELAKRGNAQLSRVADIVVSRRIAPPPFSTFLEVLRRKTTIPHSVMLALVNGAFGMLSEQDGSALSQWYDQDAVPALAAAIFTSQSEGIKRAAFESLITKPTPNRTIGRVVEFARVNYQQEMGRVADLVSALALEDRSGDLDLDTKLRDLETLPKGRELIGLLLSSESPRVISSLVRLYGDTIPSTDYLTLLAHRDKAVRLLAVENLREVNDIGALKILLDSYGEETDGDVKAAYEKYIAVVKERRS